MNNFPSNHILITILVYIVLKFFCTFSFWVYLHFSLCLTFFSLIQIDFYPTSLFPRSKYLYLIILISPAFLPYIGVCQLMLCNSVDTTVTGKCHLILFAMSSAELFTSKYLYLHEYGIMWIFGFMYISKSVKRYL